jgi:hypothetical protein
MRRPRTYLSPLLAVFIAVSFSGAGILHEVIPHYHDGVSHLTADAGDGHCHEGNNERESPLWSFIHVSIAHQHKKALIADDCAGALTLAALHPSARASSFVRVERIALLSYHELLSKGVLAFRKFG